MFGDSTYTNAEASKQMLIYYKHLNDPETACSGMRTTKVALKRGPTRRHITQAFTGVERSAGTR
jgi:hypothetical protein